MNLWKLKIIQIRDFCLFPRFEALISLQQEFIPITQMFKFEMKL